MACERTFGPMRLSDGSELRAGPPVWAHHAAGMTRAAAHAGDIVIVFHVWAFDVAGSAGCSWDGAAAWM